MRNEDLLALAYEMLPRAYCPYSHFPVGAALECEDGTVYTGCNIENAAYGATICAERTAMVKAISDGHRRFTRLAVVGNSEDYCWPCGTCRQVLREFAPDLTILAGNGTKQHLTATLDQLLPHSFGPEHLEQTKEYPNR